MVKPTEYKRDWVMVLYVTVTQPKESRKQVGKDTCTNVTKETRNNQLLVNFFAIFKTPVAFHSIENITRTIN